MTFPRDRQYKRLFQNSKVIKNEKSSTWAFIGHKIQARRGKRSEVLIHGTRVPSHKLERNIHRYSRVLPAPACECSLCSAVARLAWLTTYVSTASLSHITVRTPPATPEEIDDSGAFDGDEGGGHQSAQTPWDLVRLSSEESVWEPIDLPEESMDTIDFGNQNNLAMRARQHNLAGFVFFDTSREGAYAKSWTYPSLTAAGECHILGTLDLAALDRAWATTPPPGSGCDSHSWIWESLANSLAQFVTSPYGRSCRERLYGHPKDVTTLADYSKSDMLNFLVTVIINESSIRWRDVKGDNVGRPFFHKLLAWLSRPSQARLLQVLLSATKSSLSTALALKIACEVGFKNSGDFEGENSMGVLIMCFEALASSKDGELGSAQVDQLYQSALRWPLPQFLHQLHERGADIEGLAGKLDGLDWDGCMAQPAALQSFQTAAWLLRNGASPTPGLEGAIDTYVESLDNGKDTRPAESLIFLLLSHRADLDSITMRTMPLTLAEDGTRRCQALGAMLFDTIRNETSRDILRIYENPSDLEILGQSSSLAKEIVLLATTHHQPTDIDQLQRLIGSGVDPDVPSLLREGEAAQAIRTDFEKQGWEKHYDSVLRTQVVLGTAEDRDSFGFHETSGKPIDIVCANWNETATKLLLESGSSPPRQLLHLTSSEPPSLLERDTWGEWAIDILSRGREPRTSTGHIFMTHIWGCLLRCNHLHSVAPTMLQWAVRQEDLGLIQQLAEAGVDLQQPTFSHWSWDNDDNVGGSGAFCTPLLTALKSCSLPFLQQLWSIDARFLDIGDESPGACELSRLCSSTLSACVDLRPKISFLLDVGVDVNASFWWRDESDLSPLQVTLQAHYIRQAVMRYEVRDDDYMQHETTSNEEAGLDSKKPPEDESRRCSIPDSGRERSAQVTSPSAADYIGDQKVRDDWQATISVCEDLISRGADVNAANSLYPTPLQLAAFYGDMQMMRMLLSRKADPNIVRYEAPTGCLDLPRKEISSPLVMTCGWTSCFCTGTPGESYSGYPLSYPWNKAEAVSLLLEAGADLNMLPDSDDSALIEACRQGCLPTVQFLMRSGADVNQKGEDLQSPGCTSIQAACEGNGDSKADIVFLMLDAGAKIPGEGVIDNVLRESLSNRSVESFTERMGYVERTHVLMSEAAGGSMSRIQTLVEAGADVNGKVTGGSAEGWTPLLLATESENLSSVLILIENGADVSTSNNTGETALSMATAQGSHDIVKLLLNAGARPGAHDEKFQKALGWARQDSNSVVNLLEQRILGRDAE